MPACRPVTGAQGPGSLQTGWRRPWGSGPASGRERPQTPVPRDTLPVSSPRGPGGSGPELPAGPPGSPAPAWP